MTTPQRRSALPYVLVGLALALAGYFLGGGWLGGIIAFWVLVFFGVIALAVRSGRSDGGAGPT